MIRRLTLAACLLGLLIPAAALAQSLAPMVSVTPGVPDDDDAAPDAPWMPGSEGTIGSDAPVDRVGRRGPFRHRAPRAPQESFATVVRFLDLDEAQAGALRDLLQRRNDAVGPIHQRIHQLERELKSLLENGAGPARVGSQVLAIHEARERARAIVHRAQDAFENLLDADQRDRYGVLQRAARLRPAVHAFGSLRLLAPPTPGDIEAP